ncbi:TIGR04255 family protein [Mesorhizobium marinum]|uniref:TIGR04255 family protein n=1 Tax=Mesorhizobium marinum TaxID=3228790 RepID=UPI00346628AA
MTKSLPKKLKSDAIVEAVLELRFEPDSSSVPEIIFGRFADVEVWRGFKQARLPTADIPAPIRRADAGLRYQPSIELVSPEGSVSIRIGPQVIAYSRRSNYPGWGVFSDELQTVAKHLYRVIPNVHVSRIGLRYVNALRSDIHGINNFFDMDITVCVAGEDLKSSLNLNFKSTVSASLESMSRIASADFAQGSIPEKTTVIVDIDVYTKSSFSAQNVDDVIECIEDAHDKEKEQFFKVLGKEATDRLRED